MASGHAYYGRPSDTGVGGRVWWDPAASTEAPETGGQQQARMIRWAAIESFFGLAVSARLRRGGGHEY